jgi:ATP-binding cassette, subfamily B, bacterial
MPDPSSTPAGRIRDTRRRLRYLTWAIGLVWRAAAGWTAAALVLLVIQGLIPAGTVYLTKLLVDAVASILGVGASWDSIQPVVLPGLLMGFLLLLQQALGTVGAYVSLAQSEHVEDYIKTRIHDQAGSLDLGFFESTDYYDLLSQANSQAGSKPLQLITSLGGILQHSITLFAIAALLIPYGAWLPAVLIVTTLPALYVILRFNKVHYQWWHSRTAHRRQTQYYDMMLTLDRPAAEVRMFNLNVYFRDAYRNVRKVLRDENLALTRRQNIARMWAGLGALIMTAGVMVWVLGRAMAGYLTLGDLALFYQAFNQGQGLLRSLLGSFGTIHSSLLFLEHLHTYLAIRPAVRDPEVPLAAPDRVRKGIRFSGVAFRYPQSDRAALENFDLVVPAGKITAIVGANGAGKSTLIKLLCRFYDPEEGSVTIDGIDIRDLKTDDLRALITVLFQEPMQFQATAETNIRMGDLAVNGSIAGVEEAARQALIHDTIASLPHGYATHLGKWFGYGTELSGGQWQRVTLARAFFRKAPIVVLDEPTSAMDSWTENEWLDGFANHVRGRTALVITHRFTTAMRADLIYVMQEGRVIETGTHHSLLAMNGHYASSWKAQMARHFVADDVAFSGSDRPFPVAPFPPGELTI